MNLKSRFSDPYQPELTIADLSLSPVVGVPQGFAIYQSGVRINEAFGDTVNWDLIPDFAIAAVNLTGTNPIFGFNALGSAAAIEKKDGFSFQGVEADTRCGSYNHTTEIFRHGRHWGELAA